jgi:hypothetical protein
VEVNTEPAKAKHPGDAVGEFLSAGGVRTAGEISRVIKCRRRTVEKALAALVERGEAVAEERTTGRRGRPSRIYRAAETCPEFPSPAITTTDAKDECSVRDKNPWTERRWWDEEKPEAATDENPWR